MYAKTIYIFGLLGLSWFHLFHKHVEFAKYLLHKICKHTINMLCYIFVCQNHIFLDCLVFPDCISFIIMLNLQNIFCIKLANLYATIFLQIQHNYDWDAIRKNQAIQEYMVLAYKNVKYHVNSVFANFMQKIFCKFNMIMKDMQSGKTKQSKNIWFWHTKM